MKVFQPEENINSYKNGRGINIIYEDKNKTLWIGTSNGLYKFDRTNESFKSYRYDPLDTNSLSNDRVIRIYEDNNGKFWVGTNEGLNLFDRDNEIFTRYYLRGGDPKLRSASESDQYNLNINTIIEDPTSGDLLIGSDINGLWTFNIKERNFARYKFNDDNMIGKKIGMIQSFCKARDGKIWMISNYTIGSLNPKERTFKSFTDSPIIANAEAGNFSASVIEDRDGLIWFGLFGGETGIFCLNPKINNIQQYNLSPEKPKQANYNNVHQIYEDRSGIIWIGTWGSGVKKLDKRKNQFRVLRRDLNLSSNSLSHSIVCSVIYDPKGFIWFCTKISLDKYDIKTGIYKHYLTDEECITKSFYFGSRGSSSRSRKRRRSSKRRGWWCTTPRG